MGKSKKRDKKERMNLLRQQYEAFLEDDRKRRERNQYILKRLDNMRTCAASPHSMDAATLKMNVTGAISEASKTAVQTRSPMYISTFLQNNISNVMHHQFSKSQMAISKDTVENNIEQTILKEISKKYILIPKLPSQYYVEGEINEPTAQPRLDPIDNEWKTKYDILEKLNSIGDNDEKSFNEIKNKKDDKKLNKNITVFDDKRKEDLDSTSINSKLSRVDDSQTARISKEQYNSDNPLRLGNTSKESYSNNNIKELSVNIKSLKDEDMVFVENNALNNKIENYDYKPEEKSDTEKYDKDFHSEKSKIKNFNAYDQPLNSKTMIDSRELETSLGELKHHDSIQYGSSNPSQISHLSQYIHQPKLETVAPVFYTDTNVILAPEVENQQYGNEDHTSQTYNYEQDSQKNEKFREISSTELSNHADKNSQQEIQPSEQFDELSKTPHQGNIMHDQGWNEDKPIYQSPPENYHQVYNQEATEIYEHQIAHPEQTFEQYDYSGIESEKNNSHPNQAHETSQHKQGPNQHIMLNQQTSSAAPNQHQHNTEENEQVENEGQHHQSDKPAQNQQYTGEGQYLSNDQQGHYQKGNEAGHYLQNAEHVQYQHPDVPIQDTRQEHYLSNDEQGYYQKDNVPGIGHYSQSAEHGQYPKSDEPEQHIGQDQNLSNDEQGYYQQDNETSQYLQSVDNGQYQQSDTPKQDTVQEQYLSNEEQGHYQQDNVTGHYLQSVDNGQYQQSDTPKQDTVQEQYLANDEQGHYLQENAPSQYLQTAEYGQYQQPDIPTEGQYLPDNGGLQYEGQYQNCDSQGQDQQENVQGEYLPNVVQYPQTEGLEQYPQNNDQDQYLLNDGQSQFEGQYQYERDPNYTQQEYAEYSGHELEPADEQQAQTERDQQPAIDDIQQSVDNIAAQ